jgi:deoxyribose-phosphate aldolase
VMRITIPPVLSPAREPRTSFSSAGPAAKVKAAGEFEPRLIAYPLIFASSVRIRLASGRAGWADGQSLDKLEERELAAFTYNQIAKTIDHSLLQQQMTDAELADGCRLARQYDVASVCIKPYYVSRAVELLAGSTVVVGTTIGFPHGGHVTAIKVAEAARAMSDGATELDMVVNIGKVLGKDWRYVADDIRAVVEAAHTGKALVKVIFENCFLQDEHKEQLCRICGEVGADFVKTSTGYGSTGATDDDLKLMRRCSPPRVQVKAAGGVRNFERLLAVRAIGVTRVGATATRAILDECKTFLAASKLAHEN